MTDLPKPSLRAKHAPLFKLTRGKSSSVITYDGDILVRVRRPSGGGQEKCERLKNLPDGFHDRLVTHIAALLTGTRTILWDEQAVFGGKLDTTARSLIEEQTNG